jgi:uncharacterized membrane protein YdjX (TVP38/TMEM64 family)
MPVDPTQPAPPRRRGLSRYLPLAGLAAIALAAWLIDLPRALAPHQLARHAAELRAAAAAAPALTLSAYVLGYAVLTGACLPVALMLSLLGGLAYGRWTGGVAVLLGATGGAMLTYAATRSAFAHLLVARAGRDPRLAKIVEGFERNAFSYILTLRLVPFFPFALVNLAAGLVRAPFGAFAAATLLGGAPSAFIFASLGAGLGEALTSDESLATALRAPAVVAPLAALAVLSLLPTILRRIRRPAEP